MDTVDIGESIMTTIKSAKVLYSLSIWSLAIVCILKIMSMPSSEPTKSALYNRTHLLELNVFAGNGSNTPDYDDFVHDVETRLPSLPIAYWSKHQTQLRKKSTTCAKHPSIYDLEFNNIYWQTMRSSNGTFQLFGAYYDTRAAASKQGATVRILGMLDRIEPKVKTFCQFWYANGKNSTIVPTLEYRYMWVKQWGNYKQGIYQPYLITCRLPKPKDGNSTQLAPSSVSLVEKKCDRATNNLRVINNRRQPADEKDQLEPQQQQPKKKGFVVCVKGLDFLYEDLSVRLVEWIELLLLLGADKISFYKLQVHPNIAKVLEYYERKGNVQVTPLTLPGGQPNLPGFQHLYLKRKPGHKRLDELIPYNDCLYKHMYLYDYVALLDIDEVIMPTAENISDWQTLMAQLKALPQHNKRPQGYDSYHFRNVYFLDDQQTGHGWQADVPRYMHMLQHVYRTQNYSRPGAYVKSFHSTERVLTLHNHFPRACLRGGCRSFAVNTSMAQMQHYRADCVNELKNKCAEIRDNAIEDTTIWKFKQPLIERVTQSLFELNFLH